MNLPPTPSNLWTERYEALRRHVTEDRQLLGAEPLGLTLLLHQGLSGWMRAWQPSTATAPKSKANSEPWSPTLSSLWQQELTRLIAHMTVPHLHRT